MWGGYATLPGTVNEQNFDGIVIKSAYFQGWNVLAHEVGHFFNLWHTWGSGPFASPDACNTDDGVDDTPNTIGTSQCNLNQISCGSLDNVQNFMDFSSCGIGMMFTEGQKMRMHAALNSEIGSRNTLWQTANLIATGTNDEYVAEICKPVANFDFENGTICLNDSNEFINTSYNADVNAMTWNWSFQGGTPSSSTLKNPVVTYENDGVFDVTLTASNAMGNHSVTKTITVQNTVSGQKIPFFEGMENNSFPKHPTDPNKDWKIEHAPSWLSWERSTVAASGDGAVQIFNYPAHIGRNLLTSPSIDLSNSKNTELKFKLAFAQRTAEDTDALSVLTSTNCGKSWDIQYIIYGRDLATNGGEPIPGDFFIPDNSQWREESVSLSALDGESAVLVRFDMKSGGGHYLYMDDITITNPDITGIQDKKDPLVSLKVYPNPITQNSTIKMNIDKPAQVSMRIIDVLGNMIVEEELGKISGWYESNFLKTVGNISPGVYLLSITINNERIVKK